LGSSKESTFQKIFEIFFKTDNLKANQPYSLQFIDYNNNKDFFKSYFENMCASKEISTYVLRN
jgi:hypothetical protein